MAQSSIRTVTIPRLMSADNIRTCHLNVGGRCLFISETPRGSLLNEKLQPIEVKAEDPHASAIRFAQFLPDGGIATAHSRSLKGEDTIFIFDKNGTQHLSFPAGDGLSHFLVDSRGAFWTGYFDEGIFSGDPISSLGIANFSASGVLKFGLAKQRPENEFIDDCYTLTLDRKDRAWTCSYSKFDLGYIENGKFYEVLSEAPIHGASGLIMGQTHIALIGGYKAEGLATIIELKSLAHHQVQLVTQDGDPLNTRRRISCWAEMALCQSPQGIYRFSIDDLLQ